MTPSGPRLAVGRYPLIICTAIALHVWWAGWLLVDPASAYATAPHALLVWIGNPTDTAFVLFVAAAFAIVGLVFVHLDSRLRVILLGGQQFILVLSSFGICNAIILGQFADGVQRSHGFLATDQGLFVLVTIANWISLYLLVGRER